MATPLEQTLGRSALYELLSLGFLYPQEGAAAAYAQRTLSLAPIAARLEWVQIPRLLDGLAEALESLTDAPLIDQYVEVFGHIPSGSCPPYEGEYGQASIFQMSQTLADLSTFYEAFGVHLNPELKDRPDHISVELEFMHLLTLKEAHAQLHHHGNDKIEICRRAQESFLAHHLSNWATSFAEAVALRAKPGNLYGSLAALLRAHMEAEFHQMKITAKSKRPISLPDIGEDDSECGACPLLANTPQERSVL